MTADITNPAFTDETKAREFLESVRWPNGPVCPHCGEAERVKKLEGASTRPGLVQCNACRTNFSVTIGTLYERSHIPLHKWLLATHLMASSKKGVSAHQLHRMLGITYKSAWFMAHRIREGMTDPTPSPIGGPDSVVEIDETYVGGKAKNRKNHVPKKVALIAMVERGGEVRTAKVDRVTARNLRPIIAKRVSRKSYLMTDESMVYPKIGREFDGHGTVNHSAEEYVRSYFWHTNTAENFFSVFKRGLIGVYQAVSEQHLDRYANEFAFRYNHRAGLGVSDEERALEAVRGIEGKRLTYRQLD